MKLSLISTLALSAVGALASEAVVAEVEGHGCHKPLKLGLLKLTVARAVKTRDVLLRPIRDLLVYEEPADLR